MSLPDFSIVVAADAQWGIGVNGRLPWRLKGDMRFFREMTSCPDTDAVLARYKLDRGRLESRPQTWEQLVSASPGQVLPLPEMAEGQSPNAVIMGRKTWESLPPKFRPLPDRLNLVLTRRGDTSPEFEGALVAGSLEGAINRARRSGSDRLFVIGGGEVFGEAMAMPQCSRVFLTRIAKEYACDTFLNDPSEDFFLVASSPMLVEPTSSDSQPSSQSPTGESSTGLRYRFELWERKETAGHP